MPMLTGLDRLPTIAKKGLKGKRVGLLAHPASINSQRRHIIDVLREIKDVRVVQLFGPEHGIRGLAQDMEPVVSSVDSNTNLPVTSLYGKTLDSLTPRQEDLKDIETLIIDLQDIGTRYYTYIYTMAFCMRACATAKKDVWVLDRPNPINGIDIDGKILRKGFESFVGMYPLPIRHGMTIGELAQYFNEEGGIGCRLKVIEMEGWKREWFFDQTRLPWVNPSPNMRNLTSALLYPGLCLLEATNISEGRGTGGPFEYVGAPFIKPKELIERLKTFSLPSVDFSPLSFVPKIQKWAGMECHGVKVHVTDRMTISPILVGIALIQSIHDLYPKDFRWREAPYEFVTDIPAIDLLSGDDQLRHDIEEGNGLDQIEASWRGECEDFRKKRKKYLLY